ncbi:Beta-transducin family (WD-40 repeat) protein [Dioscorea alata]|uniref:Beta-transducin family (WD-40 repeat) protein n=1 Tax=Dioscorea alata TaxID=55571 RepID=A0ACB7U5W2_DIOAL|nr:Beta-transducin family (WD-40 repeat) protein [Dioscorea alata]
MESDPNWSRIELGKPKEVSARLISFPNADVRGKLTSDQLNVLISQYLLEEGFKHTAFAFDDEAEIENTPIDKSKIDKDALPSFVHKGLQYTQLEANMHATNDDSCIECYRLEPLDIITNSVHGLSKIIKKRKDKGKGKCIDYGVSNQEQESKQQEKNIDVHGGPQLMDHTPNSPPVTHQVSDSDVYLLDGHSLEVSACSWSPTDSLLAVGSTDSMAMIWKISNELSTIYNSNPDVQYLIRPDAIDNVLAGFNTLAWNGEGELLATGSLDGMVIIWSKNGDLKKRLGNQRAVIFFIGWNSKGDFLLTGSRRDRIVVWDTNTWEYIQEVAFHSEQLLAVTWRNDTSFAACLKDKRICVYNIGEPKPIKTFSGYQDDLHGIKCNPTGSLLASYSHGMTIKIWALDQDERLHDLMHNEIVHTVRWSPTGPCSKNPNKPYCVLASGSKDKTVKVWDCFHGQLLYCFNGHRAAVVELEFRPDGEYLASASDDKWLLIWKIRDGKIMKFHNSCDTSIYNLSWDKEGNLITAGSDCGTLCVVDVTF